jgi:hypothetical protein
MTPSSDTSQHYPPTATRPSFAPRTWPRYHRPSTRRLLLALWTLPLLFACVLGLPGCPCRQRVPLVTAQPLRCQVDIPPSIEGVEYTAEGCQTFLCFSVTQWVAHRDKVLALATWAKAAYELCAEAQP